MAIREETHVYGDHARQKLTLYVPDAPPVPCGPPNPRPALLTFHGGYWNEHSGMSGWPRRFAEEAGYVVADVRYRYNTDARWPAQRDDAAAALAWLVDHADLYAADPQRIFAFGSSAGGHIATALGCQAHGNHRLAGVIALSPPLSPYRAWYDGDATDADAKRTRLRDEAETLIGCPPERGTPGWDKWRDAVVKTHASGPDDAPALLLHFADDFVPVIHSEDLRNVQLAKGARPHDALVITIPGAGHGMTAMNAPGVAAVVRAWITARSNIPRKLSHPVRA